MKVPTKPKVEVISLLDDSDTEEPTAPPPLRPSTKRPALSSLSSNTSANDDSSSSSSKPGGVKKLKITNAAAKVPDDDAEDDDDVEVVEAPTPVWRTAENLQSSISSNNAIGNLKDDRNYEAVPLNQPQPLQVAAAAAAVELLGSTGKNALVDFPHSRENCLVHPFPSGTLTNTTNLKLCRKACPNCYCYVCDGLASECGQWEDHCRARYSEPQWRDERVRAKRAQQQQAQGPAVVSRSSSSVSNASSTSSASTTTTLRTVTSTTTRNRWPELSVRSLLEKVTAVHPVEHTPPAVVVTQLRHYQKQSLAFMLQVEQAAVPADLTTDATTYIRGGWLADEVGMGKSAVVIALVATNPLAKKDLPTVQDMRAKIADYEAHERKKDYELEAFRLNLDVKFEKKMKGIEERTRPYFALQRQKNEEYIEFLDSLNRKHSIEKLKIKPTVILTSVSLMGQWEDECKKHAPGLVVKVFHKSQNKSSSFIDLRRTDQVELLVGVDIIISTSTFSWPKDLLESFEFHRVVHDESHLMGKSSSARREFAEAIPSLQRWCVTATPCTTSVADLIDQMWFIGGEAGGRSNVSIALSSPYHDFRSSPTEENFQRLVEALKGTMIRHTKAQRINGSEALALPPSQTTTVRLNMSADEDRILNMVHKCVDRVPTYKREGANVFTIERSLSYGYPMNDILRYGSDVSMIETITLQEQPYKRVKRRFNPDHLSKVITLRSDLAQLRQSEPSMRAVVFTQYLSVHEAVARGLASDGFEVLQFTGSTTAPQRDEAIRKFQKPSSKPAVFVITIRSGNVGITLTAASRVYLLEPCLDPVVEVQAAGRIHRLGQNKPVQVVKYAFNNSYESNIVKLHEEILAGRITISDGFVPPEGVRILAKGLRA